MKTGRGWWALAGVGVLTLLGLYVGAYYATVQPMPFWGNVIPLYTGVPVSFEREAGILFHPMHCVDRWLRPSVSPPGPP